MRRWQPTSCWCLMISFPHPGLTTIPHTPPSSPRCRQPRVKARPWAGSPHLGKLESSSPAISIKHRVNTLLYWATLGGTHRVICSCSDLPITPRSRQHVHTLYGYWAIRARSAVLGFVLCKKWKLKMALSKNAHIRAQPSPYRAAVSRWCDNANVYVLLVAAQPVSAVLACPHGPRPGCKYLLSSSPLSAPVWHLTITIPGHKRQLCLCCLLSGS